MSISVIENKASTWKINEKGQSEYTRFFQVISTTIIGPHTAAAAIGINVGDYYNTPYEFNLLAFCKGAQTDGSQRFESGIVYDVSVNYGGVEYAPPEDKPPQYSWSCGQFEKDNVEHDIDDELITNTVGDIMRTKKDDPRPTLSITTWHNTPNFSLAYMYRNAVNQDSFFGSPPGTAKISDIKYDSEEYGEGETIWKFQRQISFNPDGWKDKLVNRGFNHMDNGEKKPILVKGQPVSEPVALTESGEILDDGDPPHIIEVQHYPELPFSIFEV